MSKAYYTSRGAAVQLGRELGKGGEGSVYEVPQSVTQVAKLYHRAPDAVKQSKLAFMVAGADPKLIQYAAWPQDTVHASRGGPVVGFLMPKVAGREPVHMVYSPAHRRQERPKAAWDFLMFVARNTAAAFEIVHSHGHVLGDVNQGNVMVGGDSKVVLIDCDSCQVDARGTLHFCEVGVSHFTPPELQGISSFQGVKRTANHDNFGLALLIFHLLFGGRHPYSGVPLRDGVGDALETDIKAFRYAYARDAASRGFSPPPRSIPTTLVPESVESMFQAAFTEAGAKGGRPTAKDWVTALDSLRTRLKRCSASSMHVFPDHVSSCPWCGLERQGVVYFLDLAVAYTQTATSFVLAKAWALIESVAAPAVVVVPPAANANVKGAPLPAGVPGPGQIAIYRALAIGLGFLIFLARPSFWFIACAIGFLGWGIASNVGAEERKTERNRRLADRDSARRAYKDAVEQLQREAGPQGFSAKKRELSKLRDEYQGLAAAEKREVDNLHATAQERQKQRFLDTCFIDNASIPGVGQARKTALRSFGIETAADVTRSKVRQIRGFGDGLTSAVMDWKAACERRFVFNPQTAVSVADKNAVAMRFGARRIALEVLLGNGAAELQRFRQDCANKANKLQPKVAMAAQRLAQAEADFKVF
jgi:DNA-binding helix-hairpin-helix protein with protein kinase domain